MELVMGRNRFQIVNGAEPTRCQAGPWYVRLKAALAVEHDLEHQCVESMPNPRAHSLTFALLVLSVFLCMVSGPEAGHGQNWVAFNRSGAPDESLQCFSPNNVTVAGGNLTILTRAQRATCSSFDLPRSTYSYTSGFVGMRSFNFLYGTVEFRAKFGGGTGSGAWPVVWMADVSCQASDPNGTDNDCNGQEIDIAEILHSDFAHVNQEIHVDNFTHNDGCTAPASDTSESFHIYQLIWAPGSLVFKIDGETTCTIKQPYVPKAPMYVKVSVFAGEMGGPIETKTLPWETLIDYVRVTQGGTVVFDDEFEDGSTVQPGPAGKFPGIAALNWLRRLASRRRLSWTAAALAACLLLSGAAITFRRRGA